MNPDMLTLTFLGTSSGVPTRRRNMSALALQTGPGASWVLVDCGEATQHQLLRVKLSVRDLEAILITHAHGDHCYGLPGMLASAAMHGRTNPLQLIAPQVVLDWVEATRRCGDLYLPYPLETLALEDAPAVVLERPGLRIDRHALLHRVPSVAYRLEVSRTHTHLDGDALRQFGLPRGPLWRQLQDDQDVQWQGRTIRSAEVLRRHVEQVRAVIAGDNADPGLLAEACADAQLLVHEATYTRPVLDKVGPERMHSCAEQVAAFAERIGLPNLILTHFSPRYDHGDGMAQLRREAVLQYGGTLHLARDFDQYTLSPDGALQYQGSVRR